MNRITNQGFCVSQNPFDSYFRVVLDPLTYVLEIDDIKFYIEKKSEKWHITYNKLATFN